MTAPHFDSEHATVWHGDCIEVMRTLPDASVDAVVTDPPYGLEFMGREWDGADGFRRSLNAADAGRESVFGRASRTSPEYRAGRLFQDWCELWATEALRVLKPGGHLLAFGGTRTFHRLTSGIEDAGFEIRDSIAWLYAQGFAKSWNFSTQYPGPWCECRGEAVPYSHAGDADLLRLRDDLHPSAVPRSTGEDAGLFPEMQRGGPGTGVGQARPQGPRGLVAGDGSGLLREDPRRQEPVLEGRLLHRTGEGLPDDPDAGSPEGPSERVRRGAPPRDGGTDRPTGDASRGGASHQPRPGGQPAGEPEAVPGSHVPLDDGALRGGPVCPRCGGLDPHYKGAGSALKPAFEPVVVARKPLAGTLASNVARYGTGALNIDGSRIGYRSDADKRANDVAEPGLRDSRSGFGGGLRTAMRDGGRWPANVVLDATQAAALDAQSGTLTSGKMQPTRTTAGRHIYGQDAAGGFTTMETYGDTGGASRFFYTAKASTEERPNVDGIAHPTVKPVDLMRWLVRLVTPKGGTVLEPFAGSGTTVEACVLEGFRCIAIEREADYLPLIMHRVSKPHAVGFDFGDWEDAS